MNGNCWDSYAGMNVRMGRRISVGSIGHFSAKAIIKNHSGIGRGKWPANPLVRFMKYPPEGQIEFTKCTAPDQPWRSFVEGLLTPRIERVIGTLQWNLSIWKWKTNVRQAYFYWRQANWDVQFGGFSGRIRWTKSPAQWEVTARHLSQWGTIYWFPPSTISAFTVARELAIVT